MFLGEAGTFDMYKAPPLTLYYDIGKKYLYPSVSHQKLSFMVPLMCNSGQTQFKVIDVLNGTTAYVNFH
jgi:hypothetical protein